MRWEINLDSQGTGITVCRTVDLGHRPSVRQLERPLQPRPREDVENLRRVGLVKARRRAIGHHCNGKKKPDQGKA